MKDQVLNYYAQHKKISSPLFGDVKITPQALRHLENKDKRHKRAEKEILIRYKCFLLVDRIIEKSHLYQEYKQEIQNIITKNNGRKVESPMKVKYFGLIGVIEAYHGHWIRVKVVVKKVAQWQHYEFVSVIPARNMKGYHRLYFDESL